MGNALIFGRKRSKEFEKLKEMVQNILQEWQSHVRKVVLIKNVIQAIPTYSMATFRIPKQVCEQLDSMVKHFWWGTKENGLHYMALKKWDNICEPKSSGRLGFRRFYEFDTALLAKLAWRITQGE